MREIVLALMLLGTAAHAWDGDHPTTVVPLVEPRGFDRPREQVVPVPSDGPCETRRNIFGSVTIDCADRPKITCTPNVFDGVTCR